MGFLSQLFDTSDFPPRWLCGHWTDAHGWLHILSDLGIWSAYLAIPCVLGYFLISRKDLPFRKIFFLFGAFILACGTTHLMEAVIFWWPVYRLAGVIKLLTALVSWATVLALIPIVPRVLAMRSPEELQREVDARALAESRLTKANDELEKRIAERTAELVQANSVIQLERERLRTTLASIGDGVIATDCSGRVTFLNSIAEAFTGWTSAEAEGVPLTEVFRIVNESNREVVGNPVETALREKTVVGLANQTVLIARDGSERPVDDSAAPIRDNSGTILGAVLAFRDVSERRIHERKLEESERQFRTLAESLPQLCWMADSDGRSFWYNRRWYDYTGTTFEQMGGWGWQSVHDPDILPSVTAKWKYSIATGEPFEMVFPLRAADGTYRPFLTRVIAMKDEDGRVLRWLGTNTDVSEQKRVEEQLRDARSRLESTLAAGDIGTWEFDVVHDVVRVDRNLARLFGLSDDRSDGYPFSAFLRAVHPDDQERLAGQITSALVHEEKFETECRLADTIGDGRFVVVRARVERDSDGRAVRIPGVAVDISERKRAEEAVKAGEDRLEFVVQNCGIGIWLNPLPLNALVWNDNLRAHFHLPPGAAVNIGDFYDILHPDDREPTRQKIDVAFKNRSVFDSRYRTVSRTTGAVKWIRAIGKATYSPDGVPRQFDGITLDITAQCEYEERLLESESRFRQIADTMPQIVWVANPDGGYEYLNRRWYEFVGEPPDRSLGDGWHGSLHPDDRQPVIESWQRSVAAGDDFQLEYRYRSSDGQYRWFLGRACPVRDAEGRISKWFGTCTEIEEFKRLESERHKFVSLAENSTDFIGMWSQAGDLIYINAAGLRLVGLPHEDQARQLSVDEFLFPEDRVFVTEQFLPSVHVKGHGEMEVRLRDFRTGNGLWVTFHAFPLTDPRGKHIGLVTVSRDVTQRRQMEDHLRQLAADLSDADRRKDEFLATLAHELRNPLAPIRNGLQVIRLADGNRDSANRVLPMMERQLGQLVRLVDDLLDVSRISRGKLELRRDRVDLATVINNAVDTSRPLIEASGHRLTVDLPSRPIYVDADVVRLGQVFANLLNNSAKYSSPNGHIQITVRSDENEVAISVRDSGIGIPPHMLQNVFNLFTQVDPALDRSQGGLGIGLTLVKRLVEMHEGTIVAHSDGLGLGSTFTVTLPIDRSATSSEVTGRGQDGDFKPDKLRILVADDNEDAAQSLAMMLQLLGHEVRTAGDGQQALAVAEQYRADLIFLDIGMPKLNGYEVCRRLKTKDDLAGAAVVALTGWGQEEDKSKALAAGFDHHFVKPIDPADLGALLHQLTNR